MFHLGAILSVIILSVFGVAVLARVSQSDRVFPCIFTRPLGDRWDITAANVFLLLFSPRHFQLGALEGPFLSLLFIVFSMTAEVHMYFTFLSM